MKNILRVTAIAAVLTTSSLLSCNEQKDQAAIAPDRLRKLKISPEAAQALVCSGYKLSSIKESDGYLLLEPDLVIEKAGLETEVKRNKGAKPSQYATNTIGIIDYNRTLNLKYFIHSSVGNIPIHGSSWANAINLATSD